MTHIIGLVIGWAVAVAIIAWLAWGVLAQFGPRTAGAKRRQAARLAKEVAKIDPDSIDWTRPPRRSGPWA